MTNHTVVRGGFTIERHYNVPPTRLFKAWSDKDELAKWAAPANNWHFSSECFEFKVGGREVSQFGPQGEEPYRVNSRFDDIIPNERIVTAFSIAKGSQRISSTVLSVEFRPDGKGTMLVLNEQGVFLDGQETPEMRKSGTDYQLDSLDTYLAANAG